MSEGTPQKRRNPRWEDHPLAHWLENLDHPDADTRWRAIDAVRHLADPARIVQVCVPALKDEFWRVRALAAHALFDLACEPAHRPAIAGILDPLANAILDGSPEVRLNAIATLELLGAEAGVALPRLRTALHDADDSVRAAAASAIRAIQQDGGGDPATDRDPEEAAGSGGTS